MHISLRSFLRRIESHQFLGFEETLQMSHLPNSHTHENTQLSERPPEHALIGTLTGYTEPFFSVTLIVLLLGDLIYLVQQLSHSQLQLGQFVFLRNLSVVNSVFAHLNVQMYSQL
uniref:Uncharacterized protein n=1 Tax=Cacopsylla melanoneura TaxID=428564 RepID=A0A8D8S0K7_9HEMI